MYPLRNYNSHRQHDNPPHNTTHMTTPINKDALAHYVDAATDLMPSVWRVNGRKIKVSVTDLTHDTDLVDDAEQPSVDAVITALNSRTAGLGIGPDTSGWLDDTPVRVRDIVPSGDGRTTQYSVSYERRRQ